MTIRFSTGLRTALAGGLGFATVFNRGSIEIYSGTQPATADTAVTGTLLGVATIGSGTLTKETSATGSITITGGSGSVATLTVGTFNIIPDGAVAFNTTNDLTAADLCAAINRNGIYRATMSTNVVTIRPNPGAGAAHNGYVVTSTGSVTATYGNMASGVAPVNGLTFGPETAGVVNKSGVWSFTGVAAGTAGYFRFVASQADAGALSTLLPRMDGSVAVSGGDMSLTNLSVAIGVPSTVDTFLYTQPAA